MQIITYKEFLPLVLGYDYMSRYYLHLYAYGRTVYDYNLNPTIYSEFSTAAYRFGHTLIDGEFHSIALGKQPEAYLLRDNFFNPNPLYNGNIDNIVRGLTGSPAHKFDPYVTDDV
ncbi:Heme peroxidase-like protein, partial [Leptotrombidium deliense]